MALSVAKQDVWAASLVDKPGSLARKLTALADAGANLGFVIARRTGAKKKGGVVFVTPITGRKLIAAAKKAGFKRTKSLQSVLVEGPDKPGIGANITTALA